MSSNLPDELLGVDSGDEEREPESGGDQEPVERQRVLVFEIGSKRYAATVDAVKTVVEPADITRVPRSSAAIDGVMDLRGEITAVINPRIHFQVGEAGGADQRIVVFDRPPESQPAGILVDRILGVESIPVPLFYSVEDADADDYRTESGLIAAIIQRFEDDEVVQRIAVLDTEALVDASGTVAAESTG